MSLSPSSFADQPTTADPAAHPATAAQRGIWFGQKLVPGSAVCTVAHRWHIDGSVDRAALADAFTRAARESDALSAVFADDDTGRVVQLLGVHDAHDVELVDCTEPVEVDELIEQARARAIDPAIGPCLEVTVLTTGEARTDVLIRAHHIALDVFGLMLLGRRVAELYSARVEGGEPRTPWFGRIADLVHEEQRYRESQAFAEDGAFWREYLTGCRAPSSLARTAGAAGAVAPRVRHHRVTTAAFAPGTLSATSPLGASWIDLVGAAVFGYVSSETGEPNVALRFPMMNRIGSVGASIPTTAVNVLPLRMAVDPGVSFGELASRMVDERARTRRHTRYRGEDVTHQLRTGVGYDPSGLSLNVKPFDDVFELGSATVTVESLDRGPVRDLTLTIRRAGDALELQFDADAERYSAERLAGIADGVRVFVETALTEPERGVLDVAVDARDSSVYGERVALAPADTLASLFTESAHRHADSRALRFGDTALTYRELDDAVGALAAELVTRGVRPDDRIGVLADRSTAMVVALFAVHRAGGAYVPLDPDHPAERIAYTTSDSAMRCAIVGPGHGDWCPAGVARILVDDRGTTIEAVAEGALSEPVAVAPDSSAYVLYTSGSTGRPKGVVVSHRAIVNRLRWMQAEYGLAPDDVVLQKTAFGFDVSVWEFFWPLLEGATLAVAPPGAHRDPRALVGAVRQFGVTTMHFVPTMLREFVREVDEQPLPLRRVLCSGEALTAPVRDAFHSRIDARLHNLYGPTEAAVDVTATEVPAGSAGDISIGSPVWNTDLHVLDPWLRPVPAGAVGELYVSGVQLARGYTSPLLSAGRFVPCPFRTGERMYRTGDLACLGDDGLVYFRGRVDDQIKVRGVRVELGEIESVLARCVGVESAVARVRRSAEGSVDVVGYVTPASVDVVGVRREAARWLPSAVVPAVVVPVDGFARTSSGKVDRAALPDPVVSGSSRLPESVAECRVAALFAEVLGVGGVESLGVESDFFALGGHSIVATRLVARLPGVSVRDVFDHPTVGALAALVETGENHDGTAAHTAAVGDVDIAGDVLASPGQQALWLIDRMSPAVSAYNVGGVVRFGGAAPDLPALRGAFGDVLGRHDVLRTTYRWDGERLLQDVHGANTGGTVHEIDCGDAESVAELDHALGHVFDLDAEPPIRLTLVRADTASFLVIAGHHIATDEASFPTLVRDLADAYRARSAGTAQAERPRPIQYAQFAAWYRTMLAEHGDASLDFWHDRLRDAPRTLALPYDRPRVSAEPSPVDFRTVDLPAAVAADVRAAASAHRVTPLMMLHFGVATALRAAGAGDRSPLGSPASLRDDDALSDTIGFFVNTVVLDAELDGAMTVADTLARIRDADLDAMAHRYAPFEHVVERIAPERVPGTSPLFQVMISYRHERGDAVADFGGDGDVTVLDRLSVEREYLHALDEHTLWAKFDLVFGLHEHVDGSWTVGVDFATDVFDAGTADLLLAHVAATMTLAAQRATATVDELTHEVSLCVTPAAGTRAQAASAAVPAAESRGPVRDPQRMRREAPELEGLPASWARSAALAAGAAFGLSGSGIATAAPAPAAVRAVELATLLLTEGSGFAIEYTEDADGCIASAMLGADVTDPTSLDLLAAAIAHTATTAEATPGPVAFGTGGGELEAGPAAPSHDIDPDDSEWMEFAENLLDTALIDTALIAAGPVESGSRGAGDSAETFATVDWTAGTAAPRVGVVAAVARTLVEAGVADPDGGDALLLDVEEAPSPEAAAVQPDSLWHGRLRRFPVLLPADVLDPDACTAGTLAEYCAAEDAALDEYAWLRYECDDTRDVFDEVPDARVLVRWFATSALPSSTTLPTSTTLPLTTTQLASPVPVGEYDIVVTALLDAAHARISVQIAWAPGVVDAGVSARRIAEVLRDSGIRIPDGTGYDLAALRPAHADELVPLAPHERRRVEQRFGAVRDVLPTTPLQEGLLFHLLLAEDQGVADLYASQSHVTLRGPVDPRRFSRAIGALFERHPNLTAGFVTVGDRSLQVVPARCPIPLTVVRAEEDVAVAEVLREQRAQPFSAASPPLVRFALVESARDEWTLAITFEHILIDGWSHSLMIGELLELYTDPDSTAPSGRATFRDYCAWLLERDRDAAEDAWVRYLSGIDEPTFLRPDASGAGPRPEFARDHRRDLDSVLSDAVRTTARTAGVTIGTVLHYAWGATLAKLTGRGDVVFGTTVSGRPPEIETSDAIVGLLFNTVPVRVTVSPRDTFADGLRAHQQRQIDVLDAPFVSLSAIQNRIAIPALFDTLFIVQNHPVSVPDAAYGADGEVTARRGRLDDSTHYPVSFAVDPVGDMHVRCAYRGDLFGEDDIVALTDRFVATLRALAEQPEALAGRHSIATTRERELVLGEWNATAHDIPCETVADLLEARIARVPDEIALVSAHRRMTFAELGADVDALAGTLADMDVGPESRVALMLPRDERMVVAMFAVFARGAAYVPIDGEHPTERVAYMLETSDATVVLTAAPYRDVVDDAVRTGGRGAQVLDLDLDNAARQQGSRRADGAVFTSRARPHLDNLAYIIFTSGSTGKPKGVAVGYRGLTNMYYNHVAEIFDPVVAHQGGRRMRIAHTTSFSFDASWEQLFWLLAGHEVHVVDETLRKEPTELLARYDTERIDGFDVTPSYGQILVEHGLLERDRPRGRSTSSDAAGVVFVSLGGEAVPEQLWTGLRDAPGVLGYNLYGPTEYTINALGADLADRATSNVGRPIFNTRAYVLDDAMTPVPPGVPGELYLAGAGIARGYVGRAALTCDRFVACPWGVGERMYRTGDLVRHSADGSLDYLGRSDDQVKIRGFRVEPGEISDCLAADPSVGRAVTIVRGDGAKARLLSYVVAADGAAPDVVALARRAADALPDYMVPSGIAVVEDIPLTVNGKTDARALPDIATADTESVAPVGEAEHAVAAVACALLGLDEISVTANLFDAGANSLMAMRLAARVAEDGIVPDLRVRDVFAGPTVRDIAARAGDDGQSGNAADPVLIELAPSRERTLFCFHASSGFGTVYASLVPFVADGTGVVGVQDPLHAGDSHDPAGYREVVERYTAAVVAASGDGPIELLGWSYGGHLAYAVAADLERAGRQVASLTIVDALPIPAGEAAHWTPDQLEADAYRQVLRYAGIDSAADTPGTPEELAETITQSGSALAALGRDGVAATLDACMRCNRMMLEPTAGTVSAPMALVTSPARVGDGLADRWRVHCPDLREVVETDVHHYRLLDRDAVDGWAGPVMRFVDESYGESARRVEERNR